MRSQTQARGVACEELSGTVGPDPAMQAAPAKPPHVLTAVGATTGYTELHLLADKGCATQLEELLTKKQIPVDAVDDAGFTPLHCACLHNNEDAVGLLLRFGANKAALTKRGDTPKSLVSAFASNREFVLAALGE